MAPKRLPWSVRANAGISSSRARRTKAGRRWAPSRRLKSECVCRWTKPGMSFLAPSRPRGGSRAPPAALPSRESELPAALALVADAILGAHHQSMHTGGERSRRVQTHAAALRVPLRDRQHAIDARLQVTVTEVAAGVGDEALQLRRLAPPGQAAEIP